MTQMRVQITTPYGTVDATFPDFERAVATTTDGDTTLITHELANRILLQAEYGTHLAQGDTLIGYDRSDEHDFSIAVVSRILGKLGVEVSLLSAQEPDMYEFPEGVEFSEVDGYEIDAFPFLVTVEDVTGQLYDEVKAGEA